MKKLKVIQTPARFYPYIGGVEKYVYDLSYQLVKSGHQVTVICAKEPRKTIKNVDGIKVEKLGYFGKIANTNLTFGLLIKLLTEDFDIIHTHIPTPWSADISTLISFIRRKPLLVTYHNDLLKNGSYSLISCIYSKTLLKLVFKRADKIIVTNKEYIKKSKYLHMYKNKIVVIPNGVNMDDYLLSSTKKEENKIFFLSLLDDHHRYKGLDYLIRALPIILKAFPNTQLLIGGEGILKEEYKNLAKILGLEKRIKFLGRLSENKKKELLSSSSVFVLPSTTREEGFGIVLLEAMASYTPVVATRIVGMAKDIEEYKAGIVITPKSTTEIAKAISSILAQKNKTNYGKNGRELVSEKYTWKNLVKKYEHIYSSTL